VEAEQEAVWAAVKAIYAAFLAGDRKEIDANISPDATVWDSAHEPLVRGRDELDAVRDARAPGGPAPTDLDALDPVIDVFGDVALVRHVLVVRFAPDAGLDDERIRNTSVWRKTGGRWLCVHNHEDVVGQERL
jgi:ketosteroid isomerase-like protein